MEMKKIPNTSAITQSEAVHTSTGIVHVIFVCLSSKL